MAFIHRHFVCAVKDREERLGVLDRDGAVMFCNERDVLADASQCRAVDDVTGRADGIQSERRSPGEVLDVRSIELVSAQLDDALRARPFSGAIAGS